MKDLSIIIPFVGEYPQVLFTIQSVAQSLLDTSIDFEIIAVDNYCDQAKQQLDNIIQGQIKTYQRKALEPEDIIEIHKAVPSLYWNKSGEAIKACAKGNSWLKYINYDYRLSHWQCKRVGVEESTGKILLFLDAHVVPSARAIRDMFSIFSNSKFDYYKRGTMHLPLTYKILEWRKLIYKFSLENKYFYGYKFTGFREEERPYEVPCMSTCGMMISRYIYDKIGGWPDTLGIYGGGENFMNYTLSVCGYKKFIYPDGTLFHHGEKRDYHYEYSDMVYNRALAHYLFGGMTLMKNYLSVTRGRENVLEDIGHFAVKNGYLQRSKIVEIQKTDIEEWANKVMAQQ